jgi:dTDP-glucose 4,6-dehydratase
MGKRILVTGGAGFIGSHFLDLLATRGEDRVTCLDAFTYAADPANLDNVRGKVEIIKGDIRQSDDLAHVFERGVDQVVHFAAETHVDNSIADPLVFAETNVLGTLRLLMFALRYKVEKFLHISTDEVYGSIREGFSVESDPHDPSSPYAASKSGAEKLVFAYAKTHGLPVLVTRSSNNYGPRQHGEKFIPTCLRNALAGRPIPVYGTGLNERDWLYVEDNARAVDLVLRQGVIGEAYNIGANNQRPNTDVARRLLSACGQSEELIEFVEDRKGHDFRYAVDTKKIEALGWTPEWTLDQGLKETVEWYRGRSGEQS